MRKLTTRQNIFLALGLGFLLGVFWSVGIRFFAATNTAVHYHANFAIYDRGQRLELAGPTFYEEVASCGLNGDNDPKRRVHLHDNVPDVVHVHDNGATWGHLLANLRFGLSDQALSLDDGVRIDGQDGNKLSFILNGQKVSNPSNLAINSEDKLLISYGQDDEAGLKAQFDTINSSAGEYNQKADPSACSGQEDLGFTQRLKKALSLN